MWERIKCWWKNHPQPHTWVRNIHGDEINYTNKRSVWKCAHCRDYIFKDDYYEPQTQEEKIRSVANLICFFPSDTQKMLLEEMGYKHR